MSAPANWIVAEPTTITGSIGIFGMFPDASGLFAEKLGVSKKITWYFEDNVGMTAGLNELDMLMLFGTTFIQSVYDTENYFKTKENPKELTKADFEKKRKEIHLKLTKG